MRYYSVEFHILPYSQDCCDILAALVADVGFESFSDTESGLTGYIRQDLFDRNALDAVISDFPFPGTAVTYDVSEAEDRDWNAEWEKEGFEPIVIDDGRLVIHDGRHLPDMPQTQIQIEIDARMAFGTGTHATTQMMCQFLLGMALKGCAVLDAGCGTGILSIAALRLGAARALAYDIDEWSTDNTRHNAVINGVDQQLTALNGDSTLLDGIDEKYDVITANINRNILLADMPRFCAVLRHEGFLLLSGFYVDDIPMIEQRASELGLCLTERLEDSEWVALKFCNMD